MACHEVCEYKRDAAVYRREYERLKNKVDPEKCEQAIDAEKRARLHAVNEKDRLQKRLEEQERILNNYKEELQLCKKQSLWKEEELEDQRKKEQRETTSKIKSLKKKIDSLEKELQDQKWRDEKQQKEAENRHRREIRLQQEEYEEKIRKLKEELAEKEKTIQQLTEHLQGTPVDSVQPRINKAEKDSTTSSIPPGQDPNHATIPNNRTKSGKKQGAQKGHAFHPRKRLTPDRVVHLPTPQEVKEHPEDYYRMEKPIIKQRISVTVKVEVTDYIAECYRNHKTREIIHSEFPEDLGHQFGGCTGYISSLSLCSSIWENTGVAA